MTNAERIAAHLKNHVNNILIHTIPGTQFWLVGEKIDKDSWLLTLLNPMGSVSYRVGLVSTKDHLRLWEEITRMEIGRRATAIQKAKMLRRHIYRTTIGDSL